MTSSICRIESPANRKENKNNVIKLNFAVIVNLLLMDMNCSTINNGVCGM